MDSGQQHEGATHRKPSSLANGDFSETRGQISGLAAQICRAILAGTSADLEGYASTEAETTATPTPVAFSSVVVVAAALSANVTLVVFAVEVPPFTPMVM